MQSPFRPWVNLCVIFLFSIFLIGFFHFFYLSNFEKNLINQSLQKKYLTCTFDLSGGLGNQIWRIASIYGISKKLGREPYLEIQPQNSKELTNLFPLMMDVLNIKTSPRTTKVVSFANDCCKFENPLKLKGYSEKYLKIKGNYLQSYKFFNNYKKEIEKLFECGLEIIDRVDSSKFAQEKRHKLCVHTRVGDFIPDKLLESKKEFVEPAVKYVFEYLTKKLGREEIVLGLFGDDHKFMKKLNFSEIQFAYNYGPSMRLRCDDFCLVSRHCDSFLMTASGSTFAWWMAYLLKNENAPIFYNSITSDSGNFSKDIHDFDIFPKNWIKLNLSNETGKIYEEKLWWYQRHGLKPDIDLS